MRCLDTSELRKLFEMGAGDDMSAALEHVSSCEQCGAALKTLAGRSPAAVDLAESVLGIVDCPDYEALSACVEGSVDSSAMQAHLNSCEPCTRDVERIRELRAHASLRETVEVKPGMSVRNAPSRLPLIWRVLGGIVVAGAAAAIVLALLPIGKAPNRGTNVAVAPTTMSSPVTPTSPSPVTPGTEIKPTTPAPTPPQPAANPAYRAVLVDGRYRMAKLDGKLVVVKAGAPVAVPRGLIAQMAQKLATGRVALAQPIAVAIHTVRVRGSESYVPPPTAPKLAEPVGKIILSTRPSLRWSGVQLAQSYRVTIKDAEGNTVYDETTTQAQAVSSRLPRGQMYTWQVGVRFNDNDQWTLSRAERFRVLSSDDYAQVRRAARAMPGSHLALGVAYESVGLKDEAAREYRLLHKANPRVRF